LIELRHIQYFRTLAETLHFGRAAQQLHISQPPLSRQIALLEQKLGVALFTRTRRSVQLTNAGERFYADTEKIFSMLEQAQRNALAAAEGQVGALSVGFMMSAAYNVLPTLTTQYLSRYPDVDVKLTEIVPNVQADMVRTSAIDIGVMYRPEDCRGLETVTIFREPLVAVLSRNHPLAKRRSLAITDLATEAFLIIPREVAPVYYDLTINFCLSRGFKPRIRLETNLQQTIVNLAGEGLGVAMVPNSMRNMRLSTAVFIPLQDAPMLEVAVIWNRDNLNPCVNTFAQTARDYLQHQGEMAVVSLPSEIEPE